jgi:N-acetylmuramoyl-L-alanine amidase
VFPRRTPAFGVAAALLLAAVACRRERTGAPPSLEIEAIRRHVAECPIVLSDAVLDDLATYHACTVAPEVARLVRNDYADDELRPPEFRHLEDYAFAVSRATFEAQLDRFVDPNGALRAFLWIDAEQHLLHPDPILAPGVTIPFLWGAGALQACSGACEGRLVTPPHPERPYRALRWAALRRVPRTGPPLRGVRIGVDPGHAGGIYGLLEGRHVTFHERDGEHVVQEGDLTLRTALELRSRLVALGAQVTLTRDRPSLVHPEPLHALRPAAERLLRRISLDPEYARLERALEPEDRLRLRTALALYAISRQSRFESLRARANALTRAEPDLVLSIHFNATPPGSPQAVPQDLITMVRGFHARERLYNPYHRWRAMEEAFAVADFDASVHLGALCVRAMSRALGLPVARENRYRDHLPIRDAAGQPVGVDAWDGALLRYLDGVAVLTEGPWIDDPEEARRVASELATPPGTPATRTDQYASALTSCVVEWVGRWLRSEQNPFAGDP